MENLDLTNAELTGLQFPWFALQVRTKKEVSVANSLRGKGYEPFLPLYQCLRSWSDREKIVEAALFPGYLFCRLNIQCRLPVLTTPGVVQIVGYNRSPTPVDDTEITAIKTMVASGLPSQPWPFLRVGDRAQIERGPLRGLEGILVQIRGAHRLVLSVTLLQRSVAVEIDPGSIKLLGSVPKATESSRTGVFLQLAPKKGIGLLG